MSGPLRAAYERFEQIVHTVRREMPDASDIQFVGGGDVWVHSNGAEHRTNITLDNDDDIVAWAKLFGRGGDGDEQLRRGVKGSVENAIDIAGVRLRMTFRRQYGGYALNTRILSQEPPTIDSPRFAKNPIPQTLIDLVKNSTAGLILMVGPTGSGKTTMLAALLNEVNRTQQRHVYTLEDPVEFVYRSQRSLITQREIGTHVDSFEQGMMTAKRSKPGIILLGELRSRETMRAAIESAGEGHLVLSTTHSSDVPAAISTFIGNFPSDEQNEIKQRLATTLRAVAVQRLVPSTDGKVVAVREMLVVDNTVASQIRQGAEGDKLRGTLMSSANRNNGGVLSFDDDLLARVQEEQLDTRTAMMYAIQKEEMLQKLKRLGFDEAELRDYATEEPL